MIKKSRKILTLLLASLLIMSSLGALSVSAAAATFTVSGGNKVVTNATGGSLSAEYEVSGSTVPESGWYELRLYNNATGTSNATSGYYKVTARIGAAEAVDYGAVNKSKTYPYAGRFYLTAGEDFKVTLSFDFSNVTTATTQETIEKIVFTKLEQLEQDVSSTGETKIHALDYISHEFKAQAAANFNPTTTIAEGDEAGWAGHGILGPNNYGVYRLNVPNIAMYDVYALVGCTYANTAELYVDNSATADFSTSIAKTSNYRIAAYTKIGTTMLGAGQHDLKIKFTGVYTVYFYGIKLVPSTPHTISADGMTAIDAASFVSGNPKSNTSTSVATGVIEGTHTYIGFNDPALATYYSVNSEAEQKYSVSLVASRNLTQTFRLTNVASGEFVEGTAGGTADNFITAEYRLGEMTLPAGVSMLKLNAVDYNQKFIYEIRFTPVVESTFSAGEAEVVMSGDYEEVSVPINFTGSADVCGFDIQVAYDEDVEYVGYENGDISLGTEIFTVNKNGVIFANTDNVAISNGTLATLKFEVPTQRADEFEITVTLSQVTQANGTEPAVDITEEFSAENGVIEVVSPIKFTNGTTEVDEVVCGGTMALEVDLSDASNANKNLVIFAIYSVNDGYAVLEDSEIATIDANRIATATIDTSDLASGDYYAKAFVWNGTSYYGFSQTIGQ